MLRNFLCLVLLIALLSIPAALISQIATTSIVKLDYGAQQSMRDVYPGRDGVCYVLKSKKGAVSTKWSKEKILFEKLDADLVTTHEIPLDFAKYDPDGDDSGIWLIHDPSFETYAIWAEYGDNVVRMFSSPIEQTEKVGLIHEFRVSSSKDVELVGVSSSPGSSAFAIQVQESQDEEHSKSHFAVFDASMTVLWTRTIEYSGEVYRESHAINDAGALVQLFTTKEDAEDDEPATFTLHFTQVSPDGSVTETTENLTGHYTSQEFAVGPETFTSTIYVREAKKMASKKGKKPDLVDDHRVHCFTFDAKTPGLLASTSDKLSRSTLNDFLGSSSLKLKGAYHMPDSSVVVVATATNLAAYRWDTQYSSMLTYQRIPSMSAPGGLTQVPSWNTTTTSTKVNAPYFTGIAAFRIHTTGEVDRLKTYAAGYPANDWWLMDLKPQFIDNQVYFAYMDNDKASHLIRLGVEDDQLKSRDQMFDSNEVEGRAVVPLTMSTDSEGSIIAVLNHPRKQARVVRFDLK